MSSPPNKSNAQAEHDKLLQSLQHPQPSIVYAWSYTARPSGHILALWHDNSDVDAWRDTLKLFVPWAHAAQIAAWDDAYFVHLARVSPPNHTDLGGFPADHALLYLQWNSQSGLARFMAALHDEPRINSLCRPIIPIVSLKALLDLEYSDESESDSQTSIVQV